MVNENTGDTIEEEDLTPESGPEFISVDSEGSVESGENVTEHKENITVQLEEARNQLGLASETPTENSPQEKLKEVMEFLYPSSSELYDINQLGRAIEGRDDVVQRIEQIRGVIDLIKQHQEHIQKARILSKVVNAVASATSRVVDVKSPWTGLHCFNMSVITSLTAERMGYGDDIIFMGELNYGSKMHDIGKTKVNPDVLNFTGLFRDKEGYREEMNSHAKKGAEIAGPLRKYWEYIVPHEVAVSHHEEWDGNGYPRGLTGERIPWSARIGAVADVFEALTAARPYKLTLPTGQVEEIIWQDAGKKFDPLVAAAHVDMFLSQVSPFDGQTTLEEQEVRISKTIEENGPYSEMKTQQLYEQSIEELREITVGSERKQEDYIDLFDFVDSIGKCDMDRWEDIARELENDIKDIHKVITKRQDASVVTLFVLSNAINACYEGTTEAKTITPSDVKTQNVVRMSLMMAQQMGLSISEQQAVLKRALFANAGMIGVQAEKVSSSDILGVADFKALQESSNEGLVILRELTKDAEVAEYFDDILPKDMDKLSPEDKAAEHRICEIVKVSSILVALRSQTGYKSRAMGHDEVMRELRPWVGKGKGKKFDSEIWKYVEGLWAANALGGIIVGGPHPEVISQASDLMRGYQPEIIYKTDESAKLAKVGAEVGDTLDDKDGMFDALMKGIEYRNETGIRDQDPDSILSGCALDIAIQQSNFDKLRMVEDARKFDLDVSFNKRMDMFDDRLNEAALARSSLDKVVFIRKASAVLVSLTLDFGDAGQHPDKDQKKLIIESAKRVREAYRDAVDGLLQQLDKDVSMDDNIAIGIDKKVINGVLRQIGDEHLTEEIEEKVKSIEDKIFGVRLQFKIQQIKRAIKQRDVLTGATFILEAQELLVKLKEDLDGVDEASLNVLEIELYRRGYPRMLEMLNKEVNNEQTSGIYALALISRTQEVMHRAESAEVRKEYFDSLVRKVADKVKEKSDAFWESDSLVLEDVSKISIWLQALDQAAVAVGESVLSEESKDVFKQNALGNILNNLLKEFESVLQKSASDSLRQFISNLRFYSPRLVETFPDCTDAVDKIMQDASEALFNCLVDELGHDLEVGQNNVVLSSIASFEKFCEGRSKDKPIISLSDEQVSLLNQLKVKACECKLDDDILAIERSTVDMPNIMSGVEPRLRLLVDVEYLNTAADNIEELQNQVSSRDKDDSERMQTWHQHTSKRICSVVSGFVMSEISRHFKDGDYRLIADLIDNMKQLPNGDELVNRQGVMTEDVENLVLLKYGEEIVQHLAESGDWPTFKKWQSVFERGADKENLCLNNYVKRQIMVLRRLGALGYLNSVAKILCEIRDLDAQYPQYNLMEGTDQYIEGISDDITGGILNAAEYYLDRYATGLSVCLPLFKAVGTLAKTHSDGSRAYAMRIQEEIEKTTLQEKAAWISEISEALVG